MGMYVSKELGWMAVLCLALGAGACGGGEKKVEDTSSDEMSDEEEDVEEDDGEELISELKFEEIKRTFDRKSSLVARCFPEAVEAGELGKNEKVKLTLGLEIQEDGTPKKLEILETSKRSETLEACVKTTVSRWKFTTLPRPLTYSYGFILQQF